MTENLSVERLTADARRSVRRAYYADGLFDLIIGLGLVWVCAMALAGQIVFWYLPLLLATAGLPAAKKRWVQPRTGYVRPGRPERGRLSLMIGLTALLVLGVLLTGLVRYHDEWPFLQGAYRVIGWIMQRFGLLVGLVAGAAAIWNGLSLGVRRLVGYGAGLIASGLLCLWNGAGLAWREQLPDPELFGSVFFGGLGVVMVAVGALVFARYLQAHPLQDGGPGDA